MRLVNINTFPNILGQKIKLVLTTEVSLSSFLICFPFPAVDQVVFQKRIKQQLQKSPRYPGVSTYNIPIRY